MAATRIKHTELRNVGKEQKLASLGGDGIYKVTWDEWRACKGGWYFGTGCSIYERDAENAPSLRGNGDECFFCHYISAASKAANAEVASPCCPSILPSVFTPADLATDARSEASRFQA